MRRYLLMLIAGMYVLFLVPSRGVAMQTTYSGNYTDTDSFSDYSGSSYEVSSSGKLQRGGENFFLGWLEVPHGVKTEFYRRRQEYLTPGIETFFIGLFRGFGRGLCRTSVGLFEVITFLYPQEPILEEMDEWLY